MDDYDPAAYGQAWAAVYDERFPPDEDAEAAADLVAELAAGGPVLEFAIGTGRLALPIAARGVEVHGIDASPAMVERLRTKPGGAGIAVTMGDMSSTRAPGSFAVVLLGFNTLFALPDQAAQVACFANAAAHLRPGGSFVVSAFVPDLGRFDRGQRVGVRALDGDEVGLEVSRHDPVTQRITSCDVTLRAEGIELREINIRYAWPGELDLMAQLAGLELVGRWGGWRREPFENASVRQIVQYRRPA